MSANTNKAPNFVQPRPQNRPISISSFTKPILHIDCDAFFTSVEQALHPELKGKPVVTGKERGIVACASYEAKALGVKRPMRLWEAMKALPSLICLPSDYETYSLYSKRMFEIIRRFTPDVEEYSIDEAFAEISGLRSVHRIGYAEIALKIKKTIQSELGITVSIGLSSSKSLAKIASKYKKPDGFTVVRASELHEFLPKIALEQVCGFGPNIVALLQKHGLCTVWDYVSQSEAWAKKILGKIGIELWHELRGIPVRPIITEEKHDYASISKCKTFTPPSSEREFVRAQLFRNVESAFIKMRRHNLKAKGMTVFLRDQDFRSAGAEAEFDGAISSVMEATETVNELFSSLFRSDKKYRLTGLVLFKLSPDTTRQYTLFDNVPKLESFRRIDKVIDSANAKYGKHALALGMGIWLGKHKQHLNERGDVPWRKQNLFLGETFRQHVNLPRWNIRLN